MTTSYSVLFGLTADPIHLGHEQAIINGIKYLHKLNITIQEFILIPVYLPNLIAGKKGPIASFAQRLNMCHLVATRLSKQLISNIVVSDVEKRITNSTGHNNYSFNTIKQLNKENCLFMVSADHFHGRWPKFRKWFGYKEILKHSGLLINQRPGNKINKNFINQLKAINPNIFLVEGLKSVNTSSTKIRASFKSENMSSHLSQDIIDYINDEGLYL